jgi:hypothetical protein
MILIRFIAVLCFAAFASGAIAQTTSPAASTPAAAAAAAPAAPSTCTKPGHYPGKKASDARKEAWMNEMRAWGECVKTTVADLRSQIDAKIKLANSTIEDYNAGLKELQEEQKSAEEGGGPAPKNTKP